MCVMDQQPAWGKVSGGPDVEVEADETEIGRRKKVIHEHDNTVSGDVRGVFKRISGRIVLDVYEKLHKSCDERRFGPPTVLRLMPCSTLMQRAPYCFLMTPEPTKALLRIMVWF